MFKQALKHICDLSVTQIVIGGVVIVGGGGLLYWAMKGKEAEIPIKEDDDELPDIKQEPDIEVDNSDQSTADTYVNNQGADDQPQVLPPVFAVDAFETYDSSMHTKHTISDQSAADTIEDNKSDDDPSQVLPFVLPPVSAVDAYETYDTSEQSAADTFENNQSADLSLVLPPVSAVAMTDVTTLAEDREMKVLYKIAETTTPATTVAVIEKYLANAKSEKKLPVLFLIDSIVKNIGGAYPSLFGLNIASSFSNAYEQLNELDRAAMLKLRQTWTEVFDPMKLYGLDIQVELIDPQWPVDIPSTLKIMPAVSPSEFQGSRVNNDTLDVDSTNHDPSNAATTSVIEPSVAAIRKVFPMSLEEELELMAGTYQEIQEKKRLVITAAQEHERQIKKMRSKNKRKEKKANKGKRPLWKIRLEKNSL